MTLSTPEPTPPLTDDELAKFRERVDAFTGSDHYRFSVGGIDYDGHWAHDTRRLLDEVQRLRTWQENATRLLLDDSSTRLMRERDEARADCVEMSAEKEQLERKLLMAQRARKAAMRLRQDFERKLIGWREAAEKSAVEVDRLRAELDALLPIASPHRTTKADRERNWLHGAWESFAARAKPARGAANRWAREADRLEEWSRKRKAEAESGAWPYKNCCYEHQTSRESATTPPEGDTHA